MPKLFVININLNNAAGLRKTIGSAVVNKEHTQLLPILDKSEPKTEYENHFTLKNAKCKIQNIDCKKY